MPYTPRPRRSAPKPSPEPAAGSTRSTRSAVALAAAAVLVGAGASTAAVIVEPGNRSSATDAVVQFNDFPKNQSGPTVRGATNVDAVAFDFASTRSLATQGRGQARVEAGAGLIPDLLIGPSDPATTFDAISFNLRAAGDGSVAFTVGLLGGGEFTTVEPLRGNGQNRFTIFADAGELFRSVRLAPTVGLEDVRQVRVGGVAAVPEPAALGLAALGAAGLLGRRRATAHPRGARRRRAGGATLAPDAPS